MQRPLNRACRQEPHVDKSAGSNRVQTRTDRRRWLGCAASAVVFGPRLLLAQTAGRFEPLNRYPRMVHEWFVQQVRQAEARHLAELDQLRTDADARQYVELMRTRIRASFGAEPPRTPLEPRVTGKLERDAYIVEKVIFFSRPNFPVTANLYIPKNRSGPLPAVVGTCGHSVLGKAEPAYQSFAQALARLGFVCLIYDPIGQGERLQYTTDELTSEIGAGVNEHLLAGNQQFLVGEFLGMWRAWDGIRALDYLLTRPEVDARRVGVTGNSGGGTMTTWLCGLETRWAMAAPSCFVTTFRRNLENELPADTEQCPPRALALGLDHADFLAVQAPKPVIVLAKERDYFDVRGTEEAFARLQRIYRLLGAEQNVELFVGPTTHGYSQENREAMYRFFSKAVGSEPPAAEPPLQIEPPEELWCTPRGQVAALEDNRPIYRFTAEKAEQLAADRGHVDEAELAHRLRQLLRLPGRDPTPPEYSIWRYLGSRGYRSRSAIAYSVVTEPGIVAVVYRLTEEPWYSRPPRDSRPAVLYVSDISSDEELRNEPLIAQLRERHPDLAFYTCDVRGTGESQPDTCGERSFFRPYGCDYFYTIHSFMLDRPYIGQKTHDVLRVIDWLVGLGHEAVHLAARGRGTLPATFAAVLHGAVQRVTLKYPLRSYHEIAQARRYSWPVSSFLPDVLAHFDLPDCYRALRSKGLEMIEPVGANDERIR
ncbi:MAG: xylan esterase [Pirellulaceae bacterium]|nr:MAG: xylan esterase [Pirellulaceae bacterium]